MYTVQMVSTTYYSLKAASLKWLLAQEQWAERTVQQSAFQFVYLHEFPRWLSGKESACNVGDTGDMGSILGSERPPGEENGYPLQYACLENPMSRGACWATVYEVAKSQT